MGFLGYLAGKGRWFAPRPDLGTLGTEARGGQGWTYRGFVPLL
jgi:hypothetical protein